MWGANPNKTKLDISQFIYAMNYEVNSNAKTLNFPRDLVLDKPNRERIHSYTILEILLSALISILLEAEDFLSFQMIIKLRNCTAPVDGRYFDNLHHVHLYLENVGAEFEMSFQDVSPLTILRKTKTPS